MGNTPTQNNGAVMPIDGFRVSRCPETGNPRCRYCGEVFEKHDARQEYCGRSCKIRWNAFWRAKGPALAKALYDYRIRRKEGALSDLCFLFSDFMEDFRRKEKRPRGGLRD